MHKKPQSLVFCYLDGKGGQITKTKILGWDCVKFELTSISWDGKRPDVGPSLCTLSSEQIERGFVLSWGLSGFSFKLDGDLFPRSLPTLPLILLSITWQRLSPHFFHIRQKSIRMILPKNYHSNLFCLTQYFGFESCIYFMDAQTILVLYKA